MFNPNLDCLIYRSNGETTVYGQPVPGTPHKERCGISKMSDLSERSAVRADSSASRGAAMEEVVAATILLTKSTKAEMDDVIEVVGMKLQIIGKYPRFDVTGRLDHYQIQVKMWS